jgi:hypothetical protein
VTQVQYPVVLVPTPVFSLPSGSSLLNTATVTVSAANAAYLCVSTAMSVLQSVGCGTPACPYGNFRITSSSGLLPLSQSNVSQTVAVVACSVTDLASAVASATYLRVALLAPLFSPASPSFVSVEQYHHQLAHCFFHVRKMAILACGSPCPSGSRISGASGTVIISPTKGAESTFAAIACSASNIPSAVSSATYSTLSPPMWSVANGSVVLPNASLAVLHGLNTLLVCVASGGVVPTCGPAGTCQNSIYRIASVGTYSSSVPASTAWSAQLRSRPVCDQFSELYCGLVLCGVPFLHRCERVCPILYPQRRKLCWIDFRFDIKVG